mgnify:CR=1 FL=1
MRESSHQSVGRSVSQSSLSHAPEIIVLSYLNHHCSCFLRFMCVCVCVPVLFISQSISVVSALFLHYFCRPTTAFDNDSAPTAASRAFLLLTMVLAVWPLVVLRSLLVLVLLASGLICRLSAILQRCSTGSTCHELILVWHAHEATRCAWSELVWRRVHGACNRTA